MVERLEPTVGGRGEAGERNAMGHHNAMGDHRQALPAGQALGAYRLERTLGVSAFGITYLAQDAQNRRVVIKEYLPADTVRREGAALRGASAEENDLLRRGRDRFLSDGKRLQRVKHSSIVRLLDAFETNNTGYLVFEHESGETLAATLAGSHTLNDEPLLRRFAVTLLDALDAVHQAAFLHGRIEPENIRLRSDGTPVLLDFGAARAAASLARHSARLPLTPGYAAIEQYTSQEAQGPWTDLYGLAAVLYRVVTGRDPLDAPARLLEDRLVPASDAGTGRFSRGLLKAIDAALAVRPEDRPQTVAEWRPMLDRPLAPKAAEARDPSTADDEEDDYSPALASMQEGSRSWIYVTAGVVGGVFLITAGLAGIGYLSDRNDVRRSAAGGVLPNQNTASVPPVARDTAVMPLPAAPALSDEDLVREARQREQERQAALLRQNEQSRQGQNRQEQARQEQARQEQARQEQARQEQARQEQAKQESARQEQARQTQLARQAEEQKRREAAQQEQARQAAAARAADEARQREAAARQEQARQEAARQEAARQEQARQEAARQETARQEAARAEEARQRAAAQQQEAERQAQATRLAEEIRQRDLARQQQEQITAARTLEEARAREQTRAPSDTERAAMSTGSALLMPPPSPAAEAARNPVSPPTLPSTQASRAPGAPVPLTGPIVLTPPQPQPAPQQAQPQPPAAAPQQVARAPMPSLVQPPAARPEPVVAAAPVARAAADVGRIDAVNWQWGYVVMHMDQRQGMQVGDRVFARSGDTKLWMTVRRVNGTQVSAVPDSDLQRYSVSGRVYKE